MLTNLNRVFATTLCVLLLALAGCSESEADGSASPAGDPGDTSSTTQPEEQSYAAPVEAVDQIATAPKAIPVSLGDTLQTADGHDHSADGHDHSTGAGQGLSPSQDRTIGLADPKEGQTVIPVEAQPVYVKADPASVDLGTVGTGQQAKGIITLINTGDEPMRILNCKANCGCTTTNCPRNQELLPGETVQIDVQMKAGARGGIRQSKRVDIIIEGHPLVRVPISAQVVAYVEVEPRILNLAKVTAPAAADGKPKSTYTEPASDGRVVIRSLDDQPFKVLAMNPPLIETFDDEARIEHVLQIPMEELQANPRSRTLDFSIDHPQAKKVTVTVRRPRATPNRANRADPRLPNSRRAPAGIEDNLVIAARSGNVEAISQAVKDGKNLETLANDGATLLGVAASASQAEVVRVLLEAGVNLEAVDSKGRSPLMAAVLSRQSSVEVVKALIAKGANVNTTDAMIDGSPLSWAAGPIDNPEVVAALVAANADVNTTNKLGMTPLMWAARFGSPSSVQTLVDAGADVSAKTPQGQTALDLAREKGNDAKTMESIKILEANSATSNATDS